MGRIRNDGYSDQRYGPRSPGPAVGVFVAGVLLFAYCRSKTDDKKAAVSLDRSASVARPLASNAPPLSPEFKIVANTHGEGVFLRKTPNFQDRLRAVEDGTRIEVSAATRVVDGVSWTEVRTTEGTAWVPSKYLADPPLPSVSASRP
jgi:hypothetical protein